MASESKKKAASFDATFCSLKRTYLTMGLLRSHVIFLTNVCNNSTTPCIWMTRRKYFVVDDAINVNFFVCCWYSAGTTEGAAVSTWHVTAPFLFASKAGSCNHHNRTTHCRLVYVLHKLSKLQEGRNVLLM